MYFRWLIHDGNRSMSGVVHFCQSVDRKIGGGKRGWNASPYHFMYIDPQYGITKLIRIMKGRSSRYLRQEFSWLKSRIPTLWTNSYFVATVGGAPLKAVKKYIQAQKNK